MHATSVYIAREQFIRHQPVMCTLACSEDFCTCIVRALLHKHVFVKFKSSCTAGLLKLQARKLSTKIVLS